MFHSCLERLRVLLPLGLHLYSSACSLGLFRVFGTPGDITQQ